jgi:hypothetical protein
LRERHSPQIKKTFCLDIILMLMIQRDEF